MLSPLLARAKRRDDKCQAAPSPPPHPLRYAMCGTREIRVHKNSGEKGARLPSPESEPVGGRSGAIASSGQGQLLKRTRQQFDTCQLEKLPPRRLREQNEISNAAWTDPDLHSLYLHDNVYIIRWYTFIIVYIHLISSLYIYIVYIYLVIYIDTMNVDHQRGPWPYHSQLMSN